MNTTQRQLSIIDRSISQMFNALSFLKKKDKQLLQHRDVEIQMAFVKHPLKKS